MLKDRKLCSKNSYQNSSRNGVYIAPKQICPLAAGKGKISLPVDRPTVIFMTVVPPVDRPINQAQNQRADSLPVDRPVDRGHFQRAELSGRTGPPAHGCVLSGRTGPPAHGCMHVCGRLDRSTNFCLGRPVRSTGRQPGPTF